MAKSAVTLTFPWTGPDGTKHRQGTTVQLDAGAAKTLVRNGRATWATAARSERSRRRDTTTAEEPTPSAANTTPAGDPATSERNDHDD